MSWDIFAKAFDHVMENALKSAFGPLPVGAFPLLPSPLSPFLPNPASPPGGGDDRPPPFDDPFYPGDGNVDTGGVFPYPELLPDAPPPASPSPSSPGPTPAPEPPSGDTPPPPGGDQPATPPPGGPPVPPPASDEDSGPAAEEAKRNAEMIGKMLEHLTDLDAAGISDEEIIASGEAGREELGKIHADVVAKIEELKASGALYTPEGQQLLMEYIKTRLEEARTVIEAAAAENEAKAEQTNEHAQNYEAVGGGDRDGDDHGATEHGDDGGGDTEKDSATETTEPAATQPAGLTYGTGTPGFGSTGFPGFSGGGLPGFGSGSSPGTGFMDPLTSLAGLADPERLGFNDDSADSDDDDEPDPLELKDDKDGGDDADEAGSEGESAEDGTEGATQPATVGAGEPVGEGEPPAPAPKSTEVSLPSGEVIEARTPVGAEALRAALNGAPVSEAYQKAGVTLPPAGTPVTEPIPPTKLQAGDVGMWKDHMVMSLGSGKVLVSGQEQPLESVGSGPDFLGWFDPTASASSASEQV